MKKGILNHLNFSSPIVVVVIFLIILFANYFDVLKFNYLVPPGEDPATHFFVVREILKTGKSLIYPSGFHYIIAFLSKLLDKEPLKVMVYFYPLLLVLSNLAVYLFTKKFFGNIAGVIALLIAGFISAQPRQTLFDGGFPNLIGADLLLVLGFLYLLKAYKTNKFSDALLAGVLTGLIPLFHHLSTYLAILLFPPIILSLLILSKLKGENLKNKLAILAVFFLTTLIVGAYPIYIFIIQYLGIKITFLPETYLLPYEKIKEIFHLSNTLKNLAPAIGFKGYFTSITPYLWALGWLSLPFLIRRTLLEKKEEYLFLTVWLLTVFWLSRPLSISPLPGRFARELAIPLNIASAVFIYEVFLYFQKSWQKLAILLLITFFLLRGTLNSLEWLGKYNFMVFIQKPDMEAVNWIKKNTPKETVFIGYRNTRWYPALTERTFIPLEEDLSNLREGDYLYIHRWNPAPKSIHMWQNREGYLQIRQKLKERKDIELIKNIGPYNEEGISIYKIIKEP